MISQRLKQLRLARGFSLEALAAELGGVVTKQALSKYEQGKAQPSPRMLTKLASSLGVKAAHLFSEPDISVEFIAYRKASKLPQREQLRIESCVSRSLEERVRLQQLTHLSNDVQLPVRAFSIEEVEQAEQAAEKLRELWHLGLDPIANVIGILEDHFVHVIDIDTTDSFDGISAVAYDTTQQVIAAAAVTRSGVPGERQRLNLVHELGHLVLRVSNNVDEEKAAFRFGAAFLAPAESLYQEVGRRRTSVSLEELLLLKQRFGLSLQALLYRLRNLGIITEYQYKHWCIQINKHGWRRQEPEELPPERPQWLRQNLLHALAEKLISREEAQNLLKEFIEIEEPLALIERRAFMRLPITERNRVLAEQAEKMADFYEQDTEWRETQGGDFIDY
jgi:Zn-dependent peptidase ImmA (M78 family)/DNA-binding XRE family transcriptional regulator